jgi:Ca-activated chloride channel family protein
MNLALRIAAGLLFALGLGACSAPGPQFTILSGSENDVLEPMVQEFCQSRRADLHGKYQGSLDIARWRSSPATIPRRRGMARGVDLDRHVRHRRRVKSVSRLPRCPSFSGCGGRRHRRWAGSAPR